MKIKEFIIIPSSIDAMGLIHKPGKGPNNRFGFKNVGNNKANELEETKEAPPGTYFTKTGNLVKGRLTKAAKAKGARETDPKDSQRSKVPPVTQVNEEESDIDFQLPTGKKIVLQAEDEKHTRGLVVTSNEDGSYDTYYWYEDPNDPMPIEVKIDGETVSKDAKNVRWEYHPELEEARGSCWRGYQQKGYKKKGNRMVPNCVKEEAVYENKIKLSKDPNYFGAVGLEKYKPTGPVVNIPIRQLVGFEPDDKMRDPKSMAKVNAIAKAVQDKKTIPPILARKYKNGYQVIDGHHRFWGQRKAGANAIKAQIVPPEDIEEAAGVGIVTKQNATKDVPVGGEYMNVKKLGLGKGKPKTMREEWEEFKENFADKKVKGKSRPGRVKRAGASCKGSVTSLRAKAKKSSGERKKMYHWCANMKSGRKKKK